MIHLKQEVQEALKKLIGKPLRLHGTITQTLVEAAEAERVNDEGKPRACHQLA
jgi:hypothetical protein